MNRRLKITFAFTLICMSVLAQSGWRELNDEQIFSEARTKAFASNYRDAREMLVFVLNRNSDYHDARILLGRTYVWDGQRSQARQELAYVLEKSPNNIEALSAMADVEIWDSNFTKALEVVDRALALNTQSEEMLLKKATILHELKRDDEALAVLNKLLAVDPGDEGAKKLFNLIKENNLRYQVMLNYSVDFFSKAYDPAHYQFFHIGRNNGWGASLLRLNFAQRFDLSGFQPELDLYPKISKRFYGYLNYGFSSTDLFPEYRIGAELYSKLDGGFEISAGLRLLKFEDIDGILIYTGTGTWYVRNYMITVRPFISDDDRTGTLTSGFFLIRRYFETTDDHLTITLGTGYSPEDRRLQSGSGITIDQIHILKSKRAGLQWSKSLKNNFSVLTTFDITRQELVYDENENLTITGLGFALRKKF